MEESLKDQQALIERACALHNGINDEICMSGIDIGGIRGRDGHLDGFPEGPFPEIQRLTAIREALQMVGNMLFSLQRSQLQLQTERAAALVRPEESRSFFIKKIVDHHGRNLEMIEELLEFMKCRTENFIKGADSQSKLMINDDVQEESRQIKKPIVAFIKSSLRVLLHPLKSPKAATLVGRFPLKLKKAAILVGRFSAVMAGVISVYLLHQSRQQHTIRGTETPHLTRSSHKMQENSILNISTKSETLGFANAKPSFNVLHGRG